MQKRQHEQIRLEEGYKDYELKKPPSFRIDSYKRYEFIEKGGWNKIPGQKGASSGVVCACVEGLEVLIKK